MGTVDISFVKLKVEATFFRNESTSFVEIVDNERKIVVEVVRNGGSIALAVDKICQIWNNN